MARQQSTNARSPSAKRYCANDPRVERALPDRVNADPRRAHAIPAVGAKWVNQTVLHDCFFASGHFAVPKAQADAVRQAFAAWKAVGIGLDFTEVKQLREAEVRIGYSAPDGSSASSVGRGVLQVPSTNRQRCTAGA